ncbi:toxin [Streptomyces sp. NRRL WC-3753]|nr:toxin [Streptomyces sp. NRRL WC-3753]
MSSGNALEWFKSSYSGSDGGNCIEVAYEWHRSSYSGSEGGECVEVAQEPTAIHIRDSKAPQGHVTVGPDAWAAFLGAR